MSDSLFDNLSDHELDEILKLMEECKFKQGEILLEQDGPPEAFFIIKQGSCDLVKKSETGENLSMGRAKEEMLVGELAILDSGKQPYTATASSDMTVLRMTREKIDLLSKINKKIHCKFFVSLVRYVNYRLRRANEEYASSKSSLRKF